MNQQNKQQKDYPSGVLLLFVLLDFLSKKHF